MSITTASLDLPMSFHSAHYHRLVNMRLRRRELEANRDFLSLLHLDSTRISRTRKSDMRGMCHWFNRGADVYTKVLQSYVDAAGLKVSAVQLIDAIATVDRAEQEWALSNRFHKYPELHVQKYSDLGANYISLTQTSSEPIALIESDELKTA